MEVGYGNDWKWKDKLQEKREAYRELVQHMRAMGWTVEYKQLALGVRGCVYEHLHEVLRWMGVKEHEARKRLARTLALHGARSAASIMRTYERGRRGGLETRADGGARGFSSPLRGG